MKAASTLAPAPGSHSFWLRVAGGLTTLVAVAVIIGWIADVPVLITLAPGGTPMVMNTALCVLLGGAGLLALSNGMARVAGLLGAVMAGLCALLLGQRLFGVSPGVNELLWKHQHVTPTMAPGQMAWPAAVALLLVGLALVLQATGKTRHWLLPAIGGVIIAFAVLPLLHYGSFRLFSGDSSLYRNMAVPTACCLLLFATAILHGTGAARAGSAPQSFTIAALVMLFSVGLLSAQSNADMMVANRGVVRTYQLRSDIDFFISEVARMESSARAYALTGIESFADRYDYHRVQVIQRLDGLQPIVADNPAQSDRAGRLRALAEQKFAQSAALLRIRRESGVEAAAQYLASQPTVVTSALVNLAGDMQAYEREQLVRRVQEQTTMERSVWTIEVLGSVLALALMGTSFVLTRRATAARQRAELALRDLNETLEQKVEERTRSLHFLADAMPQLVWTMRPDGTSDTFNQLWREYTGLTDDRGRNGGWQAVIHPDDVPGIRAGAGAMLQSGVEHSGEYRLKRAADGAYRWHLWRARPEYDARGRLTRWVGTSTDIHEQKAQSELLEQRVRERTAELAASEERTRLFAEHAPASVAMFDRDMRYLVHSAKWLKDYGLEGREILGCSHYEVFPEIGENWREIHRRCLAGATEVNDTDPFDRDDGTRQWLSWRVQPWRDSAGAVGGIVMFTEDITQRKQLEESLALARDQALEASRLKSEFLASMSHEIRTPMNGIIGMSGLLMETRLTPDQREMGLVVQRSAENLLTIINDILDFSKVEAGKLRVEATVFELRPLVEEVLVLVAPRAQGKDLQVTSEFDPRLEVPMLGDAGRIRQVLLNLVGNAMKFTERGGVTVRVRRLGESAGQLAWRIEIADTGIGIPAPAQRLLFQPFIQADGSMTRRFGGTGLGLAISRQLVELMGGEIGFSSEEGHGSTFWFQLKLPVHRETPAAPAAVASSPAVTGHAKLKLLVAEDNETNRIVASRFLEKLGCEIQLAVNGVEALRFLAREPFDAVLMDCQMPELDGYSATQRIRAGEVAGLNPKIPIIAVTAFAMPGDRQKCREAGMDDYLMKPLRLEELQQALVRCGLTGAKKSEATAPAASTTPAGVLSEVQLGQLRDLPGRKYPTLLQDVSEILLEETPALLAKLRTVAAQRHAETGMLAHRMAGSCANLGGLRVRTAAQAVEQAVEREAWPEVPELLTTLEAEWNLFAHALREYQSTAVS